MLSPERLCRQIESMHHSGFGGFFMHSRFGLKTEYLGTEWFDCVSACIEKARTLGMKAYLYDEDRWPSGIAAGILTQRNPALAMKYLQAAEASKSSPPENPADCLGIFRIAFDSAGKMIRYQPVPKDSNVGKDADGTDFVFTVRQQQPTSLMNNGAYIDTMNSAAVKEFIGSTHELYYQQYGRDFGGVIPAIFTDEPNYGYWYCGKTETGYHAKWSANLPEEFLKRRGYNLIPFLPELIFTGTEEFSSVRYDYYRTLTELFVESFSQQIGQWCQAHGIKLTGHVLQEGTLRTQTGAVGACMPHYEHMQWPGVDILCDQNYELATVKQCSSAANQLGKERVLSELYACTGWDWPLEGHKFLADWQFAAGVNFLCPHLSHYSLQGDGKRDFPASIMSQSPWWKYYSVVQNYLARICAAMAESRAIKDILVIHPIESVWATVGGQTWLGFGQHQGYRDRFFDAMDELIHRLTGQHYEWDFGDESLLAKYARVNGSVVTVGEMSYKLIIVPPLLTLRSSTVSLLSDFMKSGGAVLFVDSFPDRIDGKKNSDVSVLSQKSMRCSISTSDLCSAIDSVFKKSVSILENGQEAEFVWSNLRRIDGGQLLFLQSHDRRHPHQVTVSLLNAAAPVVLWDAIHATRYKIPSHQNGAKLEFEVVLPPSGSALLTMGLDVFDQEWRAYPCKPAPTKRYSISGPYTYALSERNSFPLDYCSYRIGTDSFSHEMPVLQADSLIRRQFGLSPRSAIDVQPWYRKKTGMSSTLPSKKVELRFLFDITEIPSTCLLAVENPKAFSITINGQKAANPKGFWVDEDFETIDIAGQLKTGRNEILLVFEYAVDIEIEGLFLVGDFGVGSLDADRPLTPDNRTLIHLPDRLECGSWVKQGLAFYTGSVKYSIEVMKSHDDGRICVCLPQMSCTAAVIHTAKEFFVLPWAPFEADITNALEIGKNNIYVEVIGGRKNSLGPLHIPGDPGIEPDSFNPANPKWTDEYQLTEHGLMSPVIIEHYFEREL